jgi:hypothetical protein
MKNLIFYCLIFFTYACSFTGNKLNVKANSGLSTDLQLINEYSSEYFVGLGIGESSSENTALKIARVSALGELSSNVKVFITSKLEILSSENNGEINESVSQEIVEIGNAIVRSPEFKIISSNLNSENGIFKVKVLAKKLKSNHYEEALKTIEIDDTTTLIKFLEK